MWSGADRSPGGSSSIATAIGQPVVGRCRYERRLFHGRKEEAQVALARFIVELADANFELDPTKLTFGDVLDLWYEHAQPDLELTTAETHRHELG
jgi:hypothetical protein